MKTKKLRLRFTKTTIASLSYNEMHLVRGATFAHVSCDCNNTESCSVVLQCCPPPEKLLLKSVDCS